MANPVDDNNIYGDTNQSNTQVPISSSLVSTGNPESPIEVNQQETGGKPVEYGYEVFRKLEQSTPETTLEQAERKDIKQPDPSKQQQDPNQVKKQLQQTNIQTPKYFGYNIPVQIANNFKLIARNKGKGDPSSSKTWIYVLLDRLLKMREV